MKKLIHILAFTTILFFSSKSYSQEVYIFNYDGPLSGEECQCYSFYFRMESYGERIDPIYLKNGVFIYNKKPTHFLSWGSRPDSELCGGPCRDDYYFSIEIDFIRDCENSLSNQVLVKPSAVTNSFCDKVSLTAVGCGGTQKFYWEYSKDGINFSKTNTATNLNQNYEFVKANFPSLNNYTGNIFFRVLIDSDSYNTTDDIYSNVTNYQITGCSPGLNGDPIPVAVKCANESNGSVTLKLLDNIKENQQLLLNLYDKDGFKFHKFISFSDIVNKQFTWSDIAAGTYMIRYQAQSNIDNTTKVGSMPVDSPSFIIPNKTPLTFSLTALNPLCNAGSGAVQITVSGGTAPYYYLLDNEPIAKKHLFVSSDIIENIGEGDHVVKIIDSNECIEK